VSLTLQAAGDEPVFNPDDVQAVERLGDAFRRTSEELGKVIVGQKKVIEFNGIYWHLWRYQKNEPYLTKEMVESCERIPYKKVGFDVMFIWEDELKDEMGLINKIKGF